MADNTEKNLRKNSLLVAVYKGVSMLLSMLYVPVILGYLGTDLYGIWATILNIVSWVNYFDIGIGNGLRNKLAAALARGEKNATIKSLISSAYLLLSTVVIAVMVIALVIFQFIDWNALLSIPADLYSDANLVISISFALMCVGFVFSICKSLFFAVQEAHIVNLLGVAQQMAMLASVLLLGPFEGDRLMSVAVAYGVSALLVEIGFSVAFFMRRRAWMPSVRAISGKQAKGVTGLGIQFFIVQIASLVLSSTANVIVSNIFGPAAVTPYATAFKLFTVPVSLYAAMVSPYWSSITAQYARKDIGGIRSGITRMKKMMVVPVALCLCIAVFYVPVTDVWLGQHLDTPTDLIWLMFVYSLVYCWNAVYSQAANGMSCLKMMMTLAIVQAIVSIPLSYAFATLMDSSAGVLLGMIVTMLTSSVVYPLYIKRSLDAVGRVE